MSEKPKSYDDLTREAAERWRAATTALSNSLEEQAALLAQSADVIMRPDPEQGWSHRGIVCSCGGKEFHVTRWVTIGGIRHRFEAECIECSKVGTWDWGEKRWIDR